mgnify:CR=1 FL=1
MNCTDIELEAAELKMTIKSCTVLKASQLRRMVELIELLDQCKCNCDGTKNYPEFSSIEEATAALGVDREFLWSQTNLDGVPSPRGSQIGLTKNN